MIAADTSVAIAAFAPWHERHRDADAALGDDARIVAHCVLETYSVLTRMPPPRRAGAGVVARYLVTRFPEAPLALDPAGFAALPERLAALGISGGATYDALIAHTAASAGAMLLSCDERARAVYERCGVEARFI